MGYKELKGSFAKLAASLEKGGDDLSRAWNDFCSEANESDTPYHLELILERLNSLDFKNKDIVILDHGCGGGMTLIYLAALGYRNIYGVDVLTCDCEKWNYLTEEILGIKEKRFFVYDGSHIPIKDKSVDFVFSQQVLEHVQPAVFDSFFSEEFRVLRGGGQVSHQIPHKLVPYESHTKTWISHYFFPLKSWGKLLELFVGDKRSKIVTSGHLFLRWPSVYRRMVKKHFGNCSDLTKERLKHLGISDYYDGPVALRMFLAKLIKLPTVGGMLAALLSSFMMMELAAKKMS